MIEKLEKFFKKDLELKILLNKLIIECDEVKYQDILFYALKEIKYEINKILEDFNLEENKEIINNKFENYEKKLINTSCNNEKLKKYYQNNFIDLSDNVIEELKKTNKGYYSRKDISKYLKIATSINEIIHIIHSYIINDETLYEKMEILGKRYYENEFPLILYGEKNELAHSIFMSIPHETLNGETHILGLKNKILMMIRDRGHALSIEIEIEENDIYVKYFIPKICNIEMINNLTKFGINKVKNNEIGTTGEFKTNKENLVKEIIEFIENVPTDEHIKDEDIRIK